MVREISKDAELVLIPQLIDLAETESAANPPEQKWNDLTAFDVALRVRF